MKFQKSIIDFPIVFVFHGKSAAGKTTLMTKLSEETSITRLDILPFVAPIIAKHGNSENYNALFLKTLYDNLLEEFGKNDYQSIETGSDIPDYVLPRLFDLIKRKTSTAVLIHCNATLAKARERNQTRASPVPDWILVEQDNSEKEKTFESICKLYEVPIISLDCNAPIELAYKSLCYNLDRNL